MHQVRRVAMLSLHTSPLAQPGSGDAGGMNVYVRELALELAAAGVEVEIFTRLTAPDLDAVVELAPGVLVRHVAAGPASAVAKEKLPQLVPELAAAVMGTASGVIGPTAAVTGQPAVVTDRTAGIAGPSAGLAVGSPGRQFDVIHSHYWVSGMAGLLLAEDWDLPLVHTMHTMARVKNQHTDGHAAEPSLRADGEQRIVAAATRLIANTTSEAAELERHYNGCESRIDVISPGVDLKIFKPAFRDRSRRQLGIPAQVFHVLFAGRVQRLKGPHVLVRAAALLRRLRPDIALRVSIVGSPSGSEKYDLAALVSEHRLDDVVALLPPVGSAELAQWYRSADLVAMPSSSESFGLVALEAQACGTPVVATNVGGLPRAVSDGRTGLLVDGRDPADWAAALESLHDSPQTRVDMGRAASVYAETFGWQHTADLTIASYDRALAR